MRLSTAIAAVTIFSLNVLGWAIITIAALALLIHFLLIIVSSISLAAMMLAGGCFFVLLSGAIYH